MTAATRWELDAIARLERARDGLDAILVGHVASDAATVEALAGLITSGAQRLRWRDACAVTS